jgi:myo-inositol-1(or 4)-monophosphatase
MRDDAVESGGTGGSDGDAAGEGRDGNAADATLAETAELAVTAGGAYLRDRFASGRSDAEYSAMDVKTEADHEAEDRILSVLRERHPGHAITAEESGEHAGEAVRWVVDPLDGTNNFAVGIPTFGVAATAVAADARLAADTESAARLDGRTSVSGTDPRDPLATAVAVPTLEDCYVAHRGGGVRYNGERVTVTTGDTVDPAHATVGMLVGPAVLSGGVEAREWEAVADAVESEVKRGIRTWAPVVYWGLFARGQLDGFVAYHPPEREQLAGELLAREADAVERSEGPLSVFGADEATADALWTAATDALEES